MSSERVSEELNVCYDPDGFRATVLRQLDDELTMLQKVQRPRSAITWMHLIAISLLAISAGVIFLDTEVLYLWMIVGLLLYSTNFLILLLPTTTSRARPKETRVLRSMGMVNDWLAFRLLAKKRKLAIEIGLTVFLGGIVPMVLSFTMIFGLALFFVIYYAGIANIIDWNVAFAVVVQTIMIIAFYTLVHTFEPESLGIRRFERKMERRYGRAHVESRMVLLMFLMIVISIVKISVLLVIGTLLLPNFTVSSSWGELAHLGRSSGPSLLLVLTVQLFIMRHFQAETSRSMALRLLNMRIERIKVEILAPLDALMLRKGLSAEQFDADFFEIRKRFYSLAIYDVINVDLFGRSPVYLVGPRLKYVLDDKVLNHFHG